MQKAVIVRACYDDSGDWQEYGIDEINDLLKDDWKVVSWSDTIKVQCQNCRKREEEGQ